MTRIHIFTDAERAEIETACKTVTDARVLRQLEVLRLRAEDEQIKEVTKATGYSKSSIRRIILAYKEYGLETMISKLQTETRWYTGVDLTPEHIAELRNACKTAQDKRTKRRLQALLLRSEGTSLGQTASETGLSINYISNLMHRYQTAGLASILSKPRPKRQPFIAYKHKFTAEQKAEIEMTHGTPMNKRAAAWMEVLWLRANGKSYGEIIAATGFCQPHISMILRLYKENGMQFILQNHYKDRASRSKSQ